MEKNPTTKNNDIKNLYMEIDRISSGENLFENTKCSLCYLIPGIPFRTNCCENIICNNCSESWKNKNHKECPICRNEKFSANELNRFERNIYSSIKYYCNFKSQGCLIKDLCMEQIQPHENICEFNDNIPLNCEKCAGDYLKNNLNKHDCVISLLERNKILLEKLQIEEKMKFDNGNDIVKGKNGKNNAAGFLNCDKEFSYIEQTLK